MQIIQSFKSMQPTEEGKEEEEAGDGEEEEEPSFFVKIMSF